MFVFAKISLNTRQGNREMAQRPSTHSMDTELEILQVLWRQGPTGIGDLHKSLSKQRTVAKTTVATLLNIMLRKKLIARGQGPHGYLWSLPWDTKRRPAEGL